VRGVLMGVSMSDEEREEYETDCKYTRPDFSDMDDDIAF
jgi:hypothetical protein